MPVSDSPTNRGLNCLIPARTAEFQEQIFRSIHCTLVPGNLHRMYSPLRNHIERFQTSLAPLSVALTWGFPSQCVHRVAWIAILHPDWMEAEHNALLCIQRICKAGTALWGDSLNFTSFTKKTGAGIDAYNGDCATYTLRKKKAFLPF